MIDYNKIQTYLEVLHGCKHNSTDALYTQQKAAKRPIIKKDVAQFLKQLISTNQPRQILEIGSNCGFSAVCLAEEMTTDAKLITIEINKENAILAKRVVADYAPNKQIEVINADAAKILPELNINFDLIFVDADKQNYQIYLDFAAINLKKNGIVVMDNLLWKGRVAEELPDETSSTTFLRNFNLVFIQDNRFLTSILPIGDGLGLAVKR